MLLTGASMHQQREQNHLKPQERKENSIIPMKWDFAVGKKKGILPGNCQPAPPLAVGDRKEPGSPPRSGGNRGAGAPVPVEILVPWPALKQEGGKAKRVTGPTQKVFLTFWGLGFVFFLFLGKEPRGKLPSQHWSKGLPPSMKLP